MDRNKKIVNNTIIFAIGNFGSKILAYVMVLVYTHYINASDLGYYDLILTTVSLIQPIVLMAFDEGVYRWLVGNEKICKKEVVSTCLKSTCAASFCCIILLYLLNMKFQIRDVSLIALFIISSILYQMVLNTIRGLSSNKLYAGSGILNSFLVLLFEIIGLVFINAGIEALLISKIVANFITLLFVYIFEPVFHGLIKTPFNKILAKEVFNYSAPLIPNQVSWWIVNSSDRYLILIFCGTIFNGIYSISTKFPTVVTTITGIVYLALQETIIKEYQSKDRDEFYTAIFKNYYVLLFTLISCAIPTTKIVINCFISEEYFEAWKFTGFLYLSTAFSALSSFLGIGYQISKETKRSVLTTISAAGVNVLINVLCIKNIGLHAASFSTFVAYLFLFIIRMLHSKKYFAIKVSWINFGVFIFISVFVMVISYIGNFMINLILVAITILYFVCMNYSVIVKRKAYK